MNMATLDGITRRVGEIAEMEIRWAWLTAKRRVRFYCILDGCTVTKEVTEAQIEHAQDLGHFARHIAYCLKRGVGEGVSVLPIDREDEEEEDAPDRLALVQLLKEVVRRLEAALNMDVGFEIAGNSEDTAVVATYRGESLRVFIPARSRHASDSAADWAMWLAPKLARLANAVDEHLKGREEVSDAVGRMAEALDVQDPDVDPETVARVADALDAQDEADADRARERREQREHEDRVLRNSIKLVYLSGPMTGRTNWNYPTFRRAAEDLRGLGYSVINPAETAGGDTRLSRSTFMQIDTSYVQAVDAVVVLPGWTGSAGAKYEVHVAHENGKPVFRLDFGKNDLGEAVVTGLGSRVVVKNVNVEVEYV